MALPQLSSGISLFPTHGSALKTLVLGADTAAYYAKSLGGNNVKLFSDELQLVAHRKVEVERHMRLGLNRLNGIGICLAIDDFDTDYSSMAAIRRFPVNIIKIDYSFVQDMEHDADCLEIVTAIINMAHNMGIRVIAEGVENERQLVLLKARRCDAVQGFYFSHALPADSVPDTLRSNEPDLIRRLALPGK